MINTLLLLNASPSPPLRLPNIMILFSSMLLPLQKYFRIRPAMIRFRLSQHSNLDESGQLLTIIMTSTTQPHLSAHTYRFRRYTLKLPLVLPYPVITHKWKLEIRSFPKLSTKVQTTSLIQLLISPDLFLITPDVASIQLAVLLKEKTTSLFPFSQSALLPLSVIPNDAHYYLSLTCHRISEGYVLEAHHNPLQISCPS